LTLPVRCRPLVLVVALALPVTGLAACGGDDVDVDRPRTTPELKLPEGDLSPDEGGGQGTDTTGTGTTGTEPTPTETTPTDTTQTTPPAAQQGASGGSELAGFCEENPGAC
jgi:hypothetical protein